MTDPSRCAVSACIVLFVCIFAIADHSFVHASSTDVRERGASVFHAKGCERCHSVTGVGGDRAPDLGSVGQRRGSSQIKAQILKGGHGMPPFEGVMARSDIKDLVAFLIACRTDTAPGCRKWMPAQSHQ
jgi:mono/diheme cytochrome c family protein